MKQLQLSCSRRCGSRCLHASDNPTDVLDNTFFAGVNDGF